MKLPSPTMMHPRPGNLSKEDLEKKVNTGEWWMEEKLDGVRAWVVKEHNGVRITTKNGIVVTDKFPYIVEIMEQQFRGYPWWMDGEITSSRGFNDVQSVLAGGSSVHTVTFRPFDLLSWPSDPKLYARPLSTRRVDLEKFTTNTSFVPVAQWVIPRLMMDIYDQFEENKKEGVVIKRWADDYHPDNIWLRSKFTDTVTVIPVDMDDDTLMVECAMLDADGRLRTMCDVQVDNEDMWLLLNHMCDKDAEIWPVLELTVYGVDARLNLRHPVYKGMRFETNTTACTTAQLARLRKI